MQGKTARIWRGFGGERDNSRQKSRFRERKVARKPGKFTRVILVAIFLILTHAIESQKYWFI